MQDSLTPHTSVTSVTGLRRADVIECAIVSALPFVVFFPATLLLRVFYFHDIQYYFYPYHVAASVMITHGELPLWNPYTFSGMPMIGDGQVALLYPLSWLYLILPGYAATTYLALAQFAISGSGQFLLARSFGLARLPSFVGAIVYMFSGFMTARVVHLSIQGGAALLPWVFLCILHLVRSRKTRLWLSATSFAISLQVLAGHPQVPVYTAIAAALYASISVLARWSDGCYRRYLPLLKVVGAYGLASGLVSVQLLPWMSLAASSPRAAEAGFEFVFGGSLSGSNWLLFLFPYLFGSIGEGIYNSGTMHIDTAVSLWEHSAYVGLLPLALAVFALAEAAKRFRSRGEEVAGCRWVRTLSRGETGLIVFCFALLVLGLLMAVGKYTPFARVMYIVPVLGKLRGTERSLVLVDFALSLLSAAGLQRLGSAERQSSTTRRWALLCSAYVIVLVIGAVLLGARRLASVGTGAAVRSAVINHLQLSSANSLVPLVLALVSAGMLAWWAFRPSSRRSALTAVLLVLTDLSIFAGSFNPTASSDLLTRTPAVMDFLARDDGLFRKATFLGFYAPDAATTAETLSVSWSMAYGIEDINGFNSLQSRRYTDYLFGSDMKDVSYGLLGNDRLLQSQSPILSSLNVKYLLVPTREHPRIGASYREVYRNAHVRVYENLMVLPRVYFVDRVQTEQDAKVVLRTVTADGFDGRRCALVETVVLPPLAHPGPDEVAAANITHYSANRVSIQTSTTQQRLLVLSEMYFRGWHATIDGSMTPIYRTNYLFRGIVVPPGEHTIVLRYCPGSAVGGAAISGLAIAVVVWLLRGPIASLWGHAKR